MSIEEIETAKREVMEQWAKDAEIDETMLSQESLRKTGSLHSKYYNRYMKEMSVLNTIEDNYKKIRQLKYDFYLYGATKQTIALGWELPPHKVLKTELSSYLDSENDIIAASLLLREQRILVTFLKDIITMISGRSFRIRDAIEYMKFVNGQ